MKWTGNAVADSLFGGQQNAIWAYVQIVAPYRWYTDDNSVRHDWILNNKVGLDGKYPYEPPFDDPMPNYSDDNSNAGWSANGTTHYSGDSPDELLDNNQKQFHFNDNFSTYMMYRPDGEDVQWVSLHRVIWLYDVVVNRPGSDWSRTQTPASVESVTIADDANCDTHPQWNQVIVATGTYVP